jgi:hypothetical protein
MNKPLLLFCVATGIFLFALNVKAGTVALIPAILLFSCVYIAKPKFITKSRYWERIFKEKRFFQRFVLSVLFFVFAFYVNHLIGAYVESIDGPALSDIVLNNLKPIDFGMTPIFLQRLAYVVIAICILFIWPTKLPFALKTISFLLIVRSFCLPLTHLGLPAGRISDEIGLSNLEFVNFTKDLFFSGHVAFSFMGFLLFESKKVLKYFFLINSMILSFIVLAMHLHYSIDVVAAYFFAYGTYKLATYFFKKDYELHRY